MGLGYLGEAGMQVRSARGSPSSAQLVLGGSLGSLACPGPFRPTLQSSHPDAPSFFPDPQVWAQYEEAPVEDVVTVPEEKERTANYKPVFVTEITDELHFYVQDMETGKKHELGPPWENGPGLREGAVQKGSLCIPGDSSLPGSKSLAWA